MPLTITSSSTGFITLDEVKAHANIPPSDTSHDVELDLFRGAAEEAVEDQVGPVLHRTITETAYPTTGRVVMLNVAPVLSITSVTAAGAPSSYTFDATTGFLRDVHYTGGVVVTYVAGRTTVPNSIRLAALVVAEHLWTTQRGQAPSPLQDFATGQGGTYDDLPNLAKKLLRPYLLPPAVA